MVLCAIGHALSNLPAHAGPMLPFQTDTFDPSSLDLIQRVQSGERLTGLYLGATAYQVDGDRWVIVSGHDYLPNGPTWLAYPLPESYGLEVIAAVRAFELVLRHEAAMLRRSTRAQAPAPHPPAAPPAPVLHHSRPRRPPMGPPTALGGAVPLPGLEPWTGFGRRG